MADEATHEHSDAEVGETGLSAGDEPNAAAGTAGALDEETGTPEAARAGDLTPEERLARAERRIWFWLTVAGAAVLVLFMIGFWPVMAGRLDAAKKLDQAVALIDQAGSAMAPVDKVVVAQLSSEAAPSTPDLSSETIVARRDLKQAAALIDEAMPHLTEEEQRRGDLARRVIKARGAMLDAAPGILAFSAKAVRAKNLGDQAWAYTQRASAAETRAVAAFRVQDASSVESASVAVPVIQTGLANARALYSQAATAMPAAGFARYETYIDLRLAAAKQLGAAAKAWLAGDGALSALAFSAYQKTAAKATKAAAALPYAPGAAVGTAFRKLEGRSADAYARARQEAADADKALKTP